MRTRVKIVVEVQSKNAQQVSLVEYDEVVEAFTANRPNQALTVRILAGRAGRAHDLLDANVSDALLEYVAIDGVAIADKKTPCFFVREGLEGSAGRSIRHEGSW